MANILVVNLCIAIVQLKIIAAIRPNFLIDYLGLALSMHGYADMDKSEIRGYIYEFHGYEY